jgi:Zn-dependent metalloprotease
MALGGTAAAARFDATPAAERGLAHIQANAGAAHASAQDRFAAVDVIVDANGAEHVRYTRTYAGLRVIGGDMVVHSHNGKLLSISQTLRSGIRPGSASIGGDEAIVIAGTRFGTAFDGVPTADKVIYALNSNPVLAYEVVFKGTKADQSPTEMHYFIDARSGAVLDQWDMVHTAKPGSGGGGGTAATGTGKTLMYGNVTLNTASSSGTYNMTDTTRGNGATYDALNKSYSTAARGATLFTDADNIWGNNATSDRATVAADAHYGVATTFDYYKNTHGRNGIFNDGKGV